MALDAVSSELYCFSANILLWSVVSRFVPCLSVQRGDVPGNIISHFDVAGTGLPHPGPSIQQPSIQRPVVATTWAIARPRLRWSCLRERAVYGRQPRQEREAGLASVSSAWWAGAVAPMEGGEGGCPLRLPNPPGAAARGLPGLSGTLVHSFVLPQVSQHPPCRRAAATGHRLALNHPAQPPRGIALPARPPLHCSLRLNPQADIWI